jgi:alpha-1,2-mannosyltransferase
VGRATDNSVSSRAPRRDARRRLSPKSQRKILIVVVAAVVVLGVVAVEAAFCRDHDFRVYYFAGRAALRGGDLYSPAIYPDGVGSLFRCSPAFALIFSPLSLIPRTPAAGLWTLINILCLSIFFAGATYLVKRPPSGFPTWLRGRVGAAWDGKVDWVILAAVVVTARFWLIDLRCGQVNTFMWALTALALVCDARDKPWPAGILLGVAASSKLIPLFFVGYFVLRWRWKAAAATALTVAVLWTAPALVYGWERNTEYLRDWYEVTVVFAHQGRFFYGVAVNQSLAAFFYKYCHVFGWDQTRTGLGPHAFEYLTRLAGALLIAPLFAAAYVLFRAGRRARGTLEAAAVASLDTLMVSYVSVAALLVSPVSWDTYFTLTFLPFAAIFTLAGALRSVVLRRAVVATALTAGALNFLTGDYLGELGIGGFRYRLVTVGALLLCVTLIVMFINKAAAFFRRTAAKRVS